MRLQTIASAALLLALAACSQPTTSATTAEAPPTPAAVSVEGIPAGAYTTDKIHSSLIFRISHMGYSNFTGRFPNFNATLNLDPQHPTAATLNVTIDARAITADNTPEALFGTVRNAEWLNTAQYPEITYRSTAIVQTGPNTARVAGDLTMRGVTKPVALDVTFNGGYAGMQYDPHARIGFSAHGTLKRSDFGMSAFILQPGSNLGVSDDIEVIIETEMNGPALAATPAPATP